MNGLHTPSFRTHPDLDEDDEVVEDEDFDEDFDPDADDEDVDDEGDEEEEETWQVSSLTS